MLSPVEAWWAGLCARPFDKLRVTGHFYILSLQKAGSLMISLPGFQFLGNKMVYQVGVHFFYGIGAKTFGLRP